MQTNILFPLVLIFLLTAIVPSRGFRIPLDADDGIYTHEVVNGTDLHIRIASPLTDTGLESLTSLAPRDPALPKEADDRGVQIVCGRWANLRLADVDEANEDLDRICGQGTSVYGGKNMYSIRGEVAAFVCHFGYFWEKRECSARNRARTTHQIKENCGGSNSGWAILYGGWMSYGFLGVEQRRPFLSVHLPVLLAAAAAVSGSNLGFEVPSGTPDGLYSYQAIDGRDTHTLIDSPSSSFISQLVARDPNWDDQADLEIECGQAKGLNGKDVDDANSEIDRFCGTALEIRAHGHLYSVRGEVVAFVCNNNHRSTNICHASERSRTTAAIEERCGENNAGWMLVQDESISYGYDSIRVWFCGILESQ